VYDNILSKEGEMMIIGYARVSSKTKNLDRQIKNLEEFGCYKIFREKQSGKEFSNCYIY